MHLQRVKRLGDAGPAESLIKQRSRGACKVDGCGDELQGEGYCTKHYMNYRKYGAPRTREIPARLCLHCGAEIAAKAANGPPADYCSRECGRQSYLNRLRESGELARRNEARRAAKAAAKVPLMRVCVVCNEPFDPKRCDARYCSSTCSNRYRDTHNPSCSEPDCGRGVRAKGLCAMHWRRKARAEGREVADPWCERRKANWRRRESLKRGAGDAESFSYTAVFERDGWICGLCDEHVDPDIKWPDPRSVSLDHVIPLSVGGSHSPDNAQCAHLSCNVRKGAQLIA